MRNLPSAIILFTVFVTGLATLRADQVSAPRVTGSKASEAQQAAAVVGVYCAGCHNGVRKSPSGVVLDTFDTTTIAENRDVWIRAYRQLQAGTMPPSGARRPARSGYDVVLSAIDTALETHNATPVAGSHETASRLALLLWNSGPDKSLLDDATSNRLTDRSTLEHQVTRMLADDRSEAFISRFFFPWIGLDQMASAEPDAVNFPQFNIALRDAMAKETELFLLSQLREDRDPIELWNANYTYLNAQLARHYGIDGVAGDSFQRVTLETPERWGLLGQGSVHLVTSRHKQEFRSPFTSPAARSIWVRMHFLGAPPPRPFPGAQPVDPKLPTTPQTRTLAAEPCVNCHRNFFPLGYALENFDPIGRWRSHDQGGPVDASGAFVDGTSTNGVVELRHALMQYPDAFRTTITEKLLAHTWGKPVTASRTLPETLIPARQILHRLERPRWSSIIAGVVSSQPQ